MLICVAIQIKYNSNVVWSYGAYGESRSRDPRCPWIQGRAETMVIHLRNCNRQPDNVRLQAEEQAVARGWIQAPSMSVTQPPQVAIPPPPQPIITVQIPEHLGNPPSSNSPLTPFLPPFQLSSLGNLSVVDPALISSGSLGPLYSPSATPVVSPIPGSILLPSGSAPGSRSGTPITENPPVPPALKRRRVSSNRLPSGTPPPVPGMVMQPWSFAQQERFERHIANITASCGFPFSWVENQAVREFLDDLLPNAAHLSSYQLTNRVVPQQVSHYQQAAKNASRGCEGTLQTDGWTGVNFHHFVAFVVTTVRRKVSNILL